MHVFRKVGEELATYEPGETINSKEKPCLVFFRYITASIQSHVGLLSDLSSVEG